MAGMTMTGLARTEAGMVRAPVSLAQARMNQAKAAAREQVGQLQAALALAASLAADVAEGGDAYPSGVRDVCGRLAAEVAARASQIAALTRPH